MSPGTLKIPKPMTVFVSSISGKYLSESLYECYGLNYIKYQRVQHVLLWGEKSRDRHTEKERKTEKKASLSLEILQFILLEVWT